MSVGFVSWPSISLSTCYLLVLFFLSVGEILIKCKNIFNFIWLFVNLYLLLQSILKI